VKLFSLKNFALFLYEAPKEHYFCFLPLVQRSADDQKRIFTKYLHHDLSKLLFTSMC